MTVPAPEGQINPLVLAAARLAGVDEIYRVGGAQAIAALAYGTASIKPVSKIVGPGNAYVAAAKRARLRRCRHRYDRRPVGSGGARRSSADPDFIAADLLAQAEHDAAAQSILITDDPALAAAVAAAVENNSPTCRAPRSPARAGAITGRSSSLRRSKRRCRWSTASRPSISKSWRDDAEALSDRVGNAGAIFLGATRPRRSATMSAAPITCCRPRARRASRPASAFSTS